MKADFFGEKATFKDIIDLPDTVHDRGLYKYPVESTDFDRGNIYGFCKPKSDLNLLGTLGWSNPDVSEVFSLQ